MMQDIGPKLKAKREQLGYHIEEIVEKTKIHPSAIHDIEENNFANISPAYLRGFIRLYAKFLNVDVDMDLRDVPSAQALDKIQKPGSVKPPVINKRPPATHLPKPVIAPVPEQPVVVPPVRKSPVQPMIQSKPEIKEPPKAIPPKPKPAVGTKGPLSYPVEDKPNPIIEKILNLPSAVKKSLAIAVAVVLGVVLISKALPPLADKIKSMHDAAVIAGKEHKAKAERERYLREEKKRRDQSKKNKQAVRRESRNESSDEEPIPATSAITPIPQAKSKPSQFP